MLIFPVHRAAMSLAASSSGCRENQAKIASGKIAFGGGCRLARKIGCAATQVANSSPHAARAVSTQCSQQFGLFRSVGSILMTRRPNSASSSAPILAGKGRSNASGGSRRNQIGS